MTESNETNQLDSADANNETQDVDMAEVKEGFINDDTADQEDETTKESNDDSSKDDAASDKDASIQEAAAEEDAAMEEEPSDAPQITQTQASTSPEEDTDELWDLRIVFSTTQLTQTPHTCSNDHCSTQACSIWTSNLDPDSPWYSCLDCQAGDFGGWPEEVKELPANIRGGMKGEHWELMLEKCTVDRTKIDPPNVPIEGQEEASEKTTEEGSSPAEGEEMWELKIVVNAKDLSKSKLIKCNTEDCDLVACCAWASNKDSENLWFTCLDCQAVDYDGFPGNEELPIQYLTEENRKLILEKCTEDPEKAELPDLPTEPSLLVTAAGGGGGGGKSMATITPPPGVNSAVAAGQANVVVGAVKAGKKEKAGKEKGDKPKQPSKDALEVHRRWQVEAEKLGGGKIEVSKPKAKKIIFDMLHDKFRPMNITEIYQELKATVPSPVLRSCLDDMAGTFQGNPFADGDSDDEDEKPAKKKAKKTNDSTDEYGGSLRLKEGRNASNNVYYVDYTKLQNNGNGLDPDKRNDLFADLEKAKCEEEALKKELQETAAETARLLSEPLNDELETLLVQQEKEMEELNEKLETNRAFAGNEKYTKQLNARVSKMATFWRKRKRQCMEFLMLMEDSTEGTVSVKKCLNGDGQICIDSDEHIIKSAKAYAQTKKNSTMGRKSGLKARDSNTGGLTAGLNPDPNFIGVKLNSNGNPERVYLIEN